MPITNSVKKSLRQSEVKRGRNKQRRTALRKAQKNFLLSIKNKKFEEAKKMLPSIYQIVDKSAKTHIIKKNTAARMKSRLTKKLVPEDTK